MALGQFFIQSLISRSDKSNHLVKKQFNTRSTLVNVRSPNNCSSGATIQYHPPYVATRGMEKSSWETEMLSDEELSELIGYKARAYQRRWLINR